MALAVSLFLRLGGVGSSGDKPATTPSDQRDQRDRRDRETKEKMLSTAAAATERPKRPRDRAKSLSMLIASSLWSQGLMVSNCLRQLAHLPRLTYKALKKDKKIFRYLENFA